MSSSRLRHAERDDAAAVAAVISEHERVVSGSSSYGRSDLDDEWRVLDLASDAWVLTEPDGRLVGYGTVEDRGELWRTDGYVHPDAFGRGFGGELAQFLEREARLRGARRVQNGVLEADAAAQSLLTELGYRPVRGFRVMRADLSEAPAPPDWPDGLSSSPFDAERDARAFHAAQQEAFADHWEHRERPFDDWAKYHLERTDFTPSLWTVVRDGDEIAAGAVSRPEGYGTGWVDIVFTRRPWRRRGLGAAILAETFGKFWTAGQRAVALGVDAESETGAFRLYERMGMEPEFSAVIFEKVFDD